MVRKIGFTLAEVLITLAIIGVVAVLTIPTLVANYQEKGWNTAATVFERKLEESLKVMNTQGTLAGYKTTEEFVAELQKYLKITKVCKNDDLQSCFEDKVYWSKDAEEVDMTKIKAAKDFGQKEWGTNLVGVQLANGTTGLVAYNPECKQNQYSNQAAVKSCIAILYDTSAYAKPNTQNKDLRSINVLSLGSSNCAFEVGGTCYGAPFTPIPMSFSECTGGVSTGEYVTPSTEVSGLGIEYCVGYDYSADLYDLWAGAAKQCGGVNKMPSMAQLAEIANYVYNTNDVGANTSNENLSINTAKVSSMGFIMNPGMTIMSKETVQNCYNGWCQEGVFIRAFSNNNTIADADFDVRYHSSSDVGTGLYAVCIVE